MPTHVRSDYRVPCDRQIWPHVSLWTHIKYMHIVSRCM